MHWESVIQQQHFSYAATFNPHGIIVKNCLEALNFETGGTVGPSKVQQLVQ